MTWHLFTKLGQHHCAQPRDLGGQRVDTTPAIPWEKQGVQGSGGRFSPLDKLELRWGNRLSVDPPGYNDLWHKRQGQVPPCQYPLRSSQQAAVF